MCFSHSSLTQIFQDPYVIPSFPTLLTCVLSSPPVFLCLSVFLTLQIQFLLSINSWRLDLLLDHGWHTSGYTLRESCFFSPLAANSSLTSGRVPVALLLGADLVPDFPHMLRFGLTSACKVFVLGVTTAMSSYVQLSCCVPKTLFPYKLFFFVPLAFRLYPFSLLQ